MKSTLKITLSLLAAASLVLAQDTAPVQSGQAQSGWKRVGDSGSNLGSGPAQAVNDPQLGPTAQAAPPAQLTLKSGTFITVRINQALSSDKNQPGDAFTATLVRPIVVDGLVVAQSGETLAGKVADAKKSGQNKGVSHLGVQLTDLTLVDGQPTPIQATLIGRNGPPSEGGDAAATTSAAAGATIGVLETHGHPTLITPQSVLTFRIDANLTIATDHAPQAFRPVAASDYSQPQLQTGRPGGYAAAPGGAYYAGSPYAAGYPYAYGSPYAYGYPYGYPYGYGFGYPYFGVGFYGGGFYGRGFGGGFRGGGRR
jgi:hypothetical protein